MAGPPAHMLIDVTVRLRPQLAELPAYVEGKTVPGSIKLASNETVFEPLPSVAEALEAAATTLHRYPDNGYAHLRARLAAHVGFPVEQIAAGCGSVSLSQQLIQITAGPGDEVLFGWRSFEIYPLQARTAGATPVGVPLREYTHDLDAMAAGITDRTRLIFVCNPNNPTSTVVHPDALQLFVARVPAHILIVIDEAYVHYIRDQLTPDSLDLVRHHPNVVVLRTFSKAYGLAGARLGYAVGDAELITALSKVYVPFSVSTLAQAAGVAALDASEELLARTDAVVAERSRVSAALRAAGYELPDSQANFVWLPLAAHARGFVDAAAANRIVLRQYGDDGVRVTIGAPAENDALLRFATAWKSEGLQKSEGPQKSEGH